MKYIRLYLCSPDRHAAILAGMTPAEEEYRDIPVPTFEELTVEQYGRLTTTVEGEQQHQTIARLFGMPEHLALAMTPTERRMFVDYVSEHMRQTAKAWADMGRAKEALKAVTEEQQRRPTPGDIRAAMEGHGFFRSEIEVDGQKYVVPQLIEQVCKHGQWLSAHSHIEQHAKSGDPEWRLWPQLLAVFCLKPGEAWPSKQEGETPDAFDERVDTWLGARIATMHRARFVDAIAVVAFFLSTSTEFVLIMRPHMTSTPGSPLHLLRRMPTNTPSGGA